MKILDFLTSNRRGELYRGDSTPDVLSAGETKAVEDGATRRLNKAREKVANLGLPVDWSARNDQFKAERFTLSKKQYKALLELSRAEAAYEKKNDVRVLTKVEEVEAPYQDRRDKALAFEKENRAEDRALAISLLEKSESAEREKKYEKRFPYYHAAEAMTAA